MPSSPSRRRLLPASDHDLLQATANGDGAAFGELVERHAPALFRLAQWLLGNRADAEDALQEALTGAFKAARSFGGRSSVKTWLNSIVIRQASKVRGRRKKHRLTASLDKAYDDVSSAGPSVAIESAVTTIDRRIDIAQFIQKLPDEHREVIVLREIQGLSYEEIAGVLEIPIGTVESRLYRARAGLKQMLNCYL